MGVTQTLPRASTKRREGRQVVSAQATDSATDRPFLPVPSLHAVLSPPRWEGGGG